MTALDGLDGSRDWSYARPGAHVRVLLASADQRTVVAAFASKTDRSNDLVVVLDADTGTARFGRVVASVLVETGGILVGTRILTIHDDAYVGYDIRTGDELCHWSAPAGCLNPYTLPAQARTVVLAALECGRSAGLLALDEVTGRERWRHVVETTGPTANDSTSPRPPPPAAQWCGCGSSAAPLHPARSSTACSTPRPACC
ncbi:PQQ-binding-like beta-propeller repeat protein [Amycolatopsis sp. NPDC023774]|uniref:outer membrane protein assembly factor BamB family protein n=1 Tax=Amycolatopsis sp. NPDC023774 TaxID=3155015 RepID=UPI0033CF08D4